MITTPVAMTGCCGQSSRSVLLLHGANAHRLVVIVTPDRMCERWRHFRTRWLPLEAVGWNWFAGIAVPGQPRSVRSSKTAVFVRGAFTTHVRPAAPV